MASHPLKKLRRSTKDAGLNVYDQVKKHPADLFRERMLGLHSRRCDRDQEGLHSRAADAAAAIGEGLQAFCIPGSVADQRKVGLGHGNLGKNAPRKRTQTASASSQVTSPSQPLRARSVSLRKQTKSVKNRSALS